MSASGRVRPWCLLLAVSTVLAGSPVGAEPIVFGIDHDYPPYEFVDDAGEPTGLVVELFRAVAEAEGLEVEIRPGPWAEIREWLERGEIDVASMVLTEARAELLDFSTPTLLVKHVAFVREDSGLERLRELLDLSIAVEDGSLWDDRLTDLAATHSFTLVRVPTTADAMRALDDERFAGAVLPELQGLYLLRDLGLDGIHTIGFGLSATALRFAVPKGRSRLLARLNEGLLNVRLDGTYDSLHDEWLGVLQPAPLPPSVRRAFLVGAAALAVLLAAALVRVRLLRRRVAAGGARLRETERARWTVEHEKQGLERQLVQAQRMEALGRMAGAVAHDFNNVLTTILGSASLARDAEPTPGVARLLDRIEAAGKVAADLTAQLLSFSRGRPTQPELLTWNEAIERVREVLRGAIGSQRTFELDLAPEPWTLLLDRAQAAQVVLNLVLNARDAVGPSGTIRVATSNETRDGAAVATLVVTDDGIGMGEELLARIFEPYVTTKEAGRGSGLGLATAYGIVTQAGGTIDVESAPREGTTFRVRVPRATTAAAPEPPPALEPDAPAVDPRAVLLVDDDAEVRRVGSELLASLGYAPTVVGDAEEALRTLRQRPEIAVLLTDVVLPGMDGLELARRAVEERPALRILVTSGFMGSGPPPSGRGGVRFVPKPFDRSALEAALQTVRGAAQVQSTSKERSSTSRTDT